MDSANGTVKSLKLFGRNIRVHLQLECFRFKPGRTER